MSKFNTRVLWELPTIQSLENFKDSALSYITSFQEVIIRIAKIIHTQSQTNNNFRSILTIGIILITIVSIFKYLGQRKHSFYKKQGGQAAQINKCTKMVKTQMDVTRKYILSYLGTEPTNASIQSKLHQENNQEDNGKLEENLQNLKNVIHLYQSCVKSNNKFNEYFLDEFVKVFEELKELRKNKGIRSSSKRKDEQPKKVTTQQKPKPTSAITNTSTSSSIPAPNINRNGPRIPPPVKNQKPNPSSIKKQQPAKITHQTPQFTFQQVEEKAPLITQNYKNQIKQTILQQSIVKPEESLFSSPFENPYTDSYVASNAQPTPQPQFQQQTIIEPIQTLVQSQQIPDDPILSLPTVLPTSAKHALPNLPIKPKRQLPPVGGGRRPPPPPRR